MKFDLEQAPFEDNLVEMLHQEKVDEIGNELLEQIEIDESSRQTWMDTNREWLKLASQVKEDKSFPWPGASNIKYPLLTVASMQFQARALPALINSNQPVRARVIGRDPEGQKTARANRVSKYMSYQVMEDMEGWMDEMDRLLFILPMTGIAYKKTYFSAADNKLKSKVVLPNDLIVNYHAQGFDRARMTEVVYMDLNEIVELQNAGIFANIDLMEPLDNDMNRNSMDDINNVKNVAGSDMDTHMLYESHCFLDLDEDGYKEPYIVTLTESGQVLRIVARFDIEDIKYNDKGQILRIMPENSYTSYIFLPDPSSAVSGLGLGSLLGPLNETVNTLINQLTDAGTLSNLQSGFLGRGVKLRGGAMRFRPGEWKIVNATGDDIRKSVFPMPIREPSMVLFNLLGLVIESGEKVSAVSDMMVGDNPGQNQPATTTMAVLEQGLKVFTSIHKRIHRSLAREYKQIYRLDGIFLDPEHYMDVLDIEGITPESAMQDFAQEPITIQPASDPAIVSEAQKSVKAQALLEKVQMGLPINIHEVTRMVLEAEGHENIKQLMDVPKPQPDPMLVLEQQKFEQEKQIQNKSLQLDAVKVKAQAEKDETGSQLNMAKAQEIGLDKELQARHQQAEEAKIQADMIFKSLELKQKDKEMESKKNETKQEPVRS